MHQGNITAVGTKYFHLHAINWCFIKRLRYAVQTA